MGMTAIIEPSPLFETGHIDDKRIAFPLPDRVPKPGGIRILWKRTTIGENLPLLIKFLVEHDRFPRCLDDLERDRRHQHCIRDAVRQAMQLRLVLTQGSLALLV